MAEPQNEPPRTKADAEPGRTGFLASFEARWLASPVLLAVIGLLGTGVGAIITGYWNTELERQKFEAALIQKSLETSDRAEAKNRLQFLAEAGLIRLDVDKLKAQSLNSIPVAFPLANVREVKTALKELKFYNGEINFDSDEIYVKAVIDYQLARNLVPDGFVGPFTYQKLRAEAPAAFAR